MTAANATATHAPRLAACAACCSATRASCSSSSWSALIVLALADRAVPDRRQPAEPGPADDRGRAGGAADDLRSSSPAASTSRSARSWACARSCSAYSWKNCGLPLRGRDRRGARSSAPRAGFVNGCFITRVGVPPLIMTLATLALYRGLAEGISQARSVRGYPEWFFVLGQGDVLGVPTPALAAPAGRRSSWSSVSCWRARPSAARSTPSATTRAAARFSGLPVRPRQARHLHLLRVHGRARRLGLRVARQHDPLGHGHRPRARRHRRRGRSAAPASSAAAARSSAPCIGFVLIQLLKNGLALTGVKGDATIVVIGTVLILVDLDQQFRPDPPERLARLLEARPGSHERR